MLLRAVIPSAVTNTHKGQEIHRSVEVVNQRAVKKDCVPVIESGLVATPDPVAARTGLDTVSLNVNGCMIFSPTSFAPDLN